MSTTAAYISRKCFLRELVPIETKRGLIAVDTQFLTSSALQLCAAIHAVGNRPVAAVITHPHPDHFNGTSEVDREWPGLPIYSTQATLGRHSSDQGRQAGGLNGALWSPLPRKMILPNSVVSAGAPLMIDGSALVRDDLDPGESADMTMIHLPRNKQLVASDLLHNSVHPWLAEGRTASWRSQTQSVRSRNMKASEVYAGPTPGLPGEREHSTHQPHSSPDRLPGALTGLALVARSLACGATPRQRRGAYHRPCGSTCRG